MRGRTKPTRWLLATNTLPDMSGAAERIWADPVWSDPKWIAQTQRIINSWDRLFAKPLIRRSDPEQESRVLFSAPFVVVSHGTEDDPILNFANQTAIQLWETNLADLLQMPSRKTAEPMHRDERTELLRRTTDDGYIQNYSGIRISATGNRFRIQQATVWNLVDDGGHPSGLAAAFSEWVPMPSS